MRVAGRRSDAHTGKQSGSPAAIRRVTGMALDNTTLRCRGTVSCRAFNRSTGQVRWSYTNLGSEIEAVPSSATGWSW